MTVVTPRSIAYAVIQVCISLDCEPCLMHSMYQCYFMLSSTEQWSEDCNGYDLSALFNIVVELFEEDLQSEWAVAALEWWNT